MKDIKWFVNRLRAMKLKEIIWRLVQKQQQKKEQASEYSLHLPVIQIPVTTEIV